VSASCQIMYGLYHCMVVYGSRYDVLLSMGYMDDGCLQFRGSWSFFSLFVFVLKH
jgi:hypothetical protein